MTGSIGLPLRLLSLLMAGLVLPAVARGEAPPSLNDDRQQHDPSPSPRTADTQQPPEPGLLGDPGGIRSALAGAGVVLTARYASESAYNFSGGDRHLLRETGEFDVSGQFDLQRLLGLQGGSLQTTVTYRRGRDLGADADLGVLQQIQEVYGRG